MIYARKPQQGKYPIFVCISNKGVRGYFRTDFSIEDPLQWDKGRVVHHKDAASINKYLKLELKKYKGLVEDIEGNHKFNGRQIKQIILSGRADDTPTFASFNDFFYYRIAQMEKEGRKGYAEMMRYTLQVWEKAEGDVPLCIFSHKTVEHFTAYLKRNGHTPGGIQMRLTHIKARTNELIRLGLIRPAVHPFAYTRIPSSGIRQLDLSVEQLRKIIKADTQGSKRLTLARDAFLLSFYLGGINYADLIRSDLSGNTISYRRKKTDEHKGRDRDIVFTIPPQAREIISKYIGDDGTLDFGYQFTPKNMQCYINTCLKELASTLNLPASLCFYTARKTFAQLAADIGIPYPVIEYCLGHTVKTNVTINRYIRIKPVQADAAISRVAEYIRTPETFKPYIEMRAQMQMFLGM